MKTIKIIAILCLLCTTYASSQTLNWENHQGFKGHIVSLNFGWDYASTWGIGYGYQLNSSLPIVLKADFSTPFGKTNFDDFKVKMGAEIQWFKKGAFAISTEIDGVFRRYENPHTRLLNFGSYMSAIAGYYKPKWFVAGEFAFDKAIVTHVKNSAAMREFYPGIVDGWYDPATGGNFSYGIQAGYTLKQNDLTLRLGKVIAQDFETEPTVPLYFALGYNRRFGQ